MTRKKVDLAYITDDSKRNATLKRRENGLLKKMDEISILCGIVACAIIYNPNDPQPKVWPSESGVQNVLSKYRTMSELEKSKKMMSQGILLRQMIVKAQSELKKLSDETRKKEITYLMFQSLNLESISHNDNMNDLNDLSHMIGENLSKIEKKINKSQAQKMMPVVENAGGTVTANHVQGPKNNVDAI